MGAYCSEIKQTQRAVVIASKVVEAIEYWNFPGCWQSLHLMRMLDTCAYEKGAMLSLGNFRGAASPAMNCRTADSSDFGSTTQI